MAERYTRRDAEKAMERLGVPLGHYRAHTEGEEIPPGAVLIADGRFVSIPGGWALDYASEYGGCQVQEIMYGGTGVGCPLGHERMSPREFVRAVNVACRALEILKASAGIS